MNMSQNKDISCVAQSQTTPSTLLPIPVLEGGETRSERRQRNRRKVNAMKTISQSLAQLPQGTDKETVLKECSHIPDTWGKATYISSKARNLMNSDSYKAKNVSTGPLIVWRNVNPESVLSEFKRTIRGKRMPDITDYAMKVHKEYTEHLRWDKFEFPMGFDKNEVIGAGFGVGILNQTETINFQPHQRHDDEGKFIPYGTMDNCWDYWRELELVSDPALNLEIPHGFSDTIKYFCIMTASGTKFLPTVWSATNFAISSMARVSSVMDQRAVLAIQERIGQAKGVDSTTCLSMNRETCMKTNYRGQRQWNTSSLLSKIKAYGPGDSIYRSIYNELKYRTTPDFEKTLLEIVDAPTTKAQKSLFLKFWNSNTYFVQYIRETEQQQANQEYFCNIFNVYVRYRPQIDKQPKNLAIYWQFSRPTPDQVIEINALTPPRAPGFTKSHKVEPPLGTPPSQANSSDVTSEEDEKLVEELEKFHTELKKVGVELEEPIEPTVGFREQTPPEKVKKELAVVSTAMKYKEFRKEIKKQVEKQWVHEVHDNPLANLDYFEGVIEPTAGGKKREGTDAGPSEKQISQDLQRTHQEAARSLQVVKEWRDTQHAKFSSLEYLSEIQCSYAKCEGKKMTVGCPVCEENFCRRHMSYSRTYHECWREEPTEDEVRALLGEDRPLAEPVPERVELEPEPVEQPRKNLAQAFETLTTLPSKTDQLVDKLTRLAEVGEAMVNKLQQPGVQEQLEVVKNQALQTLRTGSHISRFLSPIAGMLKSLVPEPIQGTLSWKKVWENFQLKEVIALIIFYRKATCPTQQNLILISIALCCGVGDLIYTILQNIWEYIFEQEKKDTSNIEATDGGWYERFIKNPLVAILDWIRNNKTKTGVFAVLAIFIAGLFRLGYSHTNKDDVSFTKKMADTLRGAGFMGGALVSLTAAGAKIQTFCNLVASWLYKKITGNEFGLEDKEYTQTAQKIIAMNAYYTEADGPGILEAHENHRDAVKVALGQWTSVEMMMVSDKRNLQDYLDLLKLNVGQAAHRLRVMLGKAQALQNKTATKRITPFVVMMAGPTGAGKTYATNALSEHFAKEHFQAKNDKEVENMIYNWDPNREFQDGMGPGKKIGRLEEVNAIKSGTLLAPLLTLWSSAPLTANMAALESKGLPVNLSVFFCTTNTHKVQDKGELVCPVALSRRQTVTVRATLKKEFETKDGLLDKTKFDAMTSEQKANFEHVLYSFVSPLDNSRPVDPKSEFAAMAQKSGINLANPVDYRTLKHILDEAYIYHVESEAENGAQLTGSDQRNAAAMVEDFNRLLMAVSANRNGFSTTQLALIRDAIKESCQAIDGLVAHIEFKTGKDYKNHKVPIPDWSNFFEDEATPTASDESQVRMCDYKYYGTKITVHHPNYYGQPELLKDLGMDIENLSPIPVEYKVAIMEGAKLVRYPLHVDFVRGTMTTMQGYFAWSGVDALSFEKASRLPWFRTSYAHWHSMPFEDRDRVCEAVERTLQADIVANNTLARCWRVAKEAVYKLKRNFLNPFIALFNLGKVVEVYATTFAALGLAFGLYWCIKLISDFISPAPPAIEATGSFYGDAKSSPARSSRISQGIPLIPGAVTHTEGYLKHSTHDSDTRKAAILKNLVLISYGDLCCQGFKVGGKVILIPAHALPSIKNQRKGDTYRIQVYRPQNGTWEPHQIKDTDIRQLPGREIDLVAIEIRTMESAKSMRSFFPSSENGIKVSNGGISETGVSLHYYDPKALQPIRCAISCDTAEVCSKVVPIRRSNIRLGESIKYEIRSENGMSGGIVLSNDRAYETPIVGFQSGKNIAFSYATIVYREDIDLLVQGTIQPASDDIIEGTELQLKEDHPLVTQLNGNKLDYYGEIVDPKFQTSPENLLGYQKSPIYSSLQRVAPEQRQPAIMNLADNRWQEVQKSQPKDYVHPMQHSLLKTVNHHVANHDVNEMELVVEEVADYIIKECKIKPDQLKVTNFETALHSENNRMDPHTSAGFPWKAWFPGKGKTSLFTFDDEGRVSWVNETFRKECDRWLDLLKEGQIPTMSTYLFGKAELRPIRKLFATRSIDVVPATCSVVYRRLNQQLTDRMIKYGHGNAMWCFGINPTSTDWEVLVRHLMATNPGEETLCFDLDVSNWDGHMTPQLINAVTQVINRIYADDYSIARTALSDQMVSCFSQFGSHVFKKFRGMSSGWPGTTVYNTIGHMIISYLVWRRLCRRSGRIDLQSWGAFQALTTVRLYGDDNITSVSPLVIYFYNAVTVAAMYTEIGLPATSGDKSSEQIPHRSLDEVTFLKRHFVYDPDYVIVKAPLNIDVIYDMVRWIRTSKTALITTQFSSNYYDALRELLQHEPAEWTLFVSVVRSSALAKGINLPLYQRRDMMEEILMDYIR